MTEQKLEQLYRRVEHMLDEEHREYLQGVLQGRTKLDALHEAQLLLRYLSILATEAIGWALEDQKINKDLGDIIAQYRMGIKDYEDMSRRRDEIKLKRGDDERVVDPSRESAMARLASVVGDD
jgi:hypothetical protein